MRSLREAAEIIRACDTPQGLQTLVARLGFSVPTLALDDDARHRLGLPCSVAAAGVAQGDGALRALVVEASPGASAREVTAVAARQLARRVPHLLWMTVVTSRDSDEIVVAASATGGNQRLVALVTGRDRIVDSDAETLCALAGCTGITGPGHDVLRHLRWIDILGRESITRRFYRALDRVVTTLAQSLVGIDSPLVARELALLTASRFLFLAFVQTKGWLDRDFGFLPNRFADAMASGGAYHRRVLEPLFFGTLNTRVSNRSARARELGAIPFLNGGLFSRSPLERIHRHARFTDDALGDLFGELLVRYRFTAREDTATWSEAAVDPEMLGKAFESLMASGERKRHGVYYTPRDLVERTTDRALRAHFSRVLDAGAAERALAGDQLSAHDASRVLAAVSSMRILDPACGSGAFLVHALERLAALRVTAGDARPIAVIRRDVLTNSIFGVDSNPTAVWLCELRLWLSAVIDAGESDPMKVQPLPNLDRHIRVGDSLAGPAFVRATHNGGPQRTDRSPASVRASYWCAEDSARPTDRQIGAPVRHHAH